MTLSNDNKPNAAGVCPICQSATTPKYAPFCSKRCADVDLHRWLNGSYAIAAADDESESAAEDGGD